MTTAPADLLDELAHRGIELQAEGGRLRYRPRSAITPDLAERVKAHKPEPPAPWPGHVAELGLRDGRWSWRQRRMDQADRAYAAYVGRRITSRISDDRQR